MLTVVLASQKSNTFSPALCCYLMRRSAKPVFNNIQVNGTMTYITRKIKNSQQLGEFNPS